MATLGPSHFAEISNCQYTPSGSSAIAIWSVSSIRITQSSTLVYGMDNNKKRAVSSHLVAVNDRVEIETNDIKAMIDMQAQKGSIGVLTFTELKSSQQLTASPLANQTVTISQLVIEDVEFNDPSKTQHGGRIVGRCLETSGGADPVSFA